MFPKKTLIACAATGLLLGLGSAAMAATNNKQPAKQPTKEAKSKPAKSEMIATVQPPSGNWEPAPPPADGWVWSKGYYAWVDGHFEWKKGEWVLDKEGMDYRQREWVPAGEGKWKLVGGDYVPEKHAKAN